MGNKICLPFPHFLGELGRDKDNEMLDHKDVRSNHGTNMLKDILAAATRFANRPAMVIDEKYYTYSELFSYVESLYSALRIINDPIVGIVAENKVETYASILAVLYAGKTYVMLHPDYPEERNMNIISQTDMGCLFHTDETIGLVASCSSIKRINVTLLVESDNEEYSFKQYDCLESDSDAYIIFTSGSTGTPKGVPISRSNLNAFYKAYHELGWKLDENDRMLQMFELTFDVSVVSFLYPLTIGASIYTITKGFKYLNVLSTIETFNVTFAAIAPSVLRFSRGYFQGLEWPFLKYLIVTAEATDEKLISDFRKCIPNAEIVNLYGPTETTIYCTAYKIPTKNCKTYNGTVAIGRAFNNIETLIIADNGEVASCGTKGELLVSGSQVMNGYWKADDKTQECFIQIGGKLYYRTGDLCFIDEDCDIIYCGRKDTQVKIQGFRIELGEIEYVGKQFYNNEANVVAVIVENAYGVNTIQLVVESHESDKQRLLLYMTERLPSYMVPEDVKFLPCFPLNSNNKTDRKKILEIITT